MSATVSIALRDKLRVLHREQHTTLGQKIRLLRRQKGLTLRQLGDLTQSSKGFIWELENDIRTSPSSQKIVKVARALGVTIDYLLDTQANMTKEDAQDAAFCAKYLRMDAVNKAKVRNLVDIWTE